MTIDPLDMLVQETINLTNAVYKDKDPYTDFTDDDELPPDFKFEYLGQENNLTINSNVTSTQPVTFVTTSIYPTTSGIIYFINQNVSTFAIKALPVKNICKFMTSNISNSEFSNNLDSLNFFPTEYFELAEVITDQIKNRRFPIYEEDVCNLSDPGFSWWMKETDYSFKVFFRSHGTNATQQLSKLGPIGDSSLALKRLKNLLTYAITLFPIKQSIVDDRQMSIVVDENSHNFDENAKKHFNDIKKLFLLGQEPPAIDIIFKQELSKTLYYYLKELAGTRKFWIEIESKLKKSRRIV
ncbi:MAG: hypothetical protein HQK51_04545 [Oligoflexia bacterium]|nr:hypothetical protein [Oligoflexia bacterium]